MEEKEKIHSDVFWQERDLASFCECTGLMPMRCWSEEEDEAYAELYQIHRSSPGESHP